MEKIKAGIEVGSKVVIEGRTYWVTDVGHNEIGFMLDPDEHPQPSGKKEYPFWRVFFCILLTALIIRMVF
jgi:hypothetical protein